MKEMKIFGWNKPKTLYRYIKNGDLFCYQVSKKVFGYGRIIAKNKLGATVEIFNFFTSTPIKNFNYTDSNNYPVLLKCVLDCVTLFQAKLESDWRIIAQDPNYINLTPKEITSINVFQRIANNADFTYSERIEKEKALKRIENNYGLDETPHSHYHILNLLIRYKPDLFCSKNVPFVGFDDFICDSFKKIHNKNLSLE